MTGVRASRRRLAPALVVTLTALVTAASATAEPAGIASKQAEATRVLGQIRELDSAVSKAAEAWNLANIRLARIEKEQRANQRRLVLARSNFRAGQKTLEARLVELYTSDAASGSTLDVLLGATSLDDLLNRIETAERVSEQDAEVLRQVRTHRAEVQRRKAALARARARQARVVAERAARKAEIERRLAERQRLLASIKSEIERLQAAERERQRRLEAQARARLAAQRSTASAPAPVQAAAPVAATPSAAPPPARYGGVVGIAMQYLGIPYKWGGASPQTGFDCSGFVMYVYAQVGVSLPHSTYALWGIGSPVSRNQLQPGDLVFFNGLGHMGIYIGGNQMIHAPHTGDVVKISSLSGWYASTYVGARRP